MLEVGSILCVVTQEPFFDDALDHKESDDCRRHDQVQTGIGA